MRIVFLGLIKIYKIFISPIFVLLFGKGCRYEPTCSSYAYESIKIHGVIKGGKIALTRFKKCHPFSAGGFDPVPKNI